MHGNRKRGRIKAFGVGLVEVALGLGVLTIGMAGLTQIGSDAASQTRALATATRLEQVHQAAIDYVRANQAALTTATSGGAVATVYAGRATVSGGDPGSSAAGLPSLQGGGFLPSAYVDTNSFGQRHAVLIRQPTAGRLEFLVTQFGGRQIRDSDLGRISQKLGASGGAILERPVGGVAANTIVGTGGGWRAAAATWSGGAVTPALGHAMSYSGLSSTGTGLEDFLYRGQIPGVPEANTMRTAINMGGNDITAARDLEVTGAISNPAAGGAVHVADPLTVDAATSLCASGGACSVTVGGTAAGNTYGSLYSANNGWVHFTAAGDSVSGANFDAAANGGLAVIGSDASGGVGGNLVVGGRSELRGRVEVRNDWVRIYGSGRGVFWENQGSGLYMPDVNWIQTYGGAGILTTSGNGIYATAGQIRSDASMAAPYFSDVNDPGYYVDPNGTNRLNYVDANNVNAYGFVNAQGSVTANGNITSNFGNVSASNGNVYAAGNVQAGANMHANAYYGLSNFGYLLQPQGTSRMNYVEADNVAAYGNIRAIGGGYVKTGQVSGVGAGCESGAIAINAATGGMLFCQWGTYQEPGAAKIGMMYGGGGDFNSFYCEPGYHITGYHTNVGNTNNALYALCVKDGY